MRFKRRYISIQIKSDSKVLKSASFLHFKHQNLHDLFVEAIQNLYGDHGLAIVLPSLSIMYINNHTNIAILRVSRKSCNKVNEILTFLNMERLNQVIVIKNLSGSIQKSKLFLKNSHFRRSILSFI